MCNTITVKNSKFDSNDTNILQNFCCVNAIPIQFLMWERRSHTQWCSGKFSLVGTLAWHYGHIPYRYRGVGVQIYVQTVRVIFDIMGGIVIIHPACVVVRTVRIQRCSISLLEDLRVCSSENFFEKIGCILESILIIY